MGELVPVDSVERSIIEIRGVRVILDSDLAALYGVETRRLNEQMKRNRGRFPSDFVFQLGPEECERLRSQFAISNIGRGGRRSPPFAYTEHGALMAASVLNSQEAIQMSVFVVRAFLRMRAALNDTRALTRKLAALEHQLKGRLDVHEAAIVDVLQRIMKVLDPPPPPPEPPPPEIGFHVKEDAVPYRTKRKVRV